MIVKMGAYASLILHEGCFVCLLKFGTPLLVPAEYKVKTNVGKQSVSYMAIDIWKDLPSSLKDLSVYVFPKYIKRILPSEQKRN